MLESTIVLWGSYQLLQQHRFTLRLDEVQTDSLRIRTNRRRAAGRRVQTLSGSHNGTFQSA
jgi:hypothetical protein